MGNGAAFLDATAIQDVFDFRNQLARSTLDVPHRFVASWNYELPFGKGKRWGREWSGLQAVLGGWQTSGVWSWQSGTPLNIIASGFPTAVGNAQRRADRVQGVDAAYSLEDAQANVRSGGTWFNTAAFAQPGDYLFGIAPAWVSSSRPCWPPTTSRSPASSTRACSWSSPPVVPTDHADRP